MKTILSNSYKNQEKKVICGVDGTPCCGQCKEKHTRDFNVFCDQLIVKDEGREREVKVYRAF